MKTVFKDRETREAFVDSVLEHLGANYMVGDTMIKGQSLTHLQQCLRMPHKGRRWTLPGGYWGITSALEEAGFKIVRGRTMRYTRNGAYKPYQECDVVTL